MFWYIYRNFAEARWVFRDWKEENLRFCINPDDAKKWRKDFQSLVKQVEIYIPPKKTINVHIPIASKEYAFTPSTAFADFVNWSKMESRMKSVLNKIMDLYEIDVYGVCRERRAAKKIKKDDFAVLMAMRDIIEWMFRISPIEIQTWFNKEEQKPIYWEWDIGSDVYDATYEVAWKKYKTNLFGVYVPAVRDAMFPDSDFDGSTLQSRQRDFLLNRGKITFVLATRWWGKSLSTTSLTGNYMLKELTAQFERQRPFDMHYFGLSRESNSQVAWYIRKMMLSLIDNKKVIDWRSTEMRLTMKDWRENRNIKYMSQHQEWVGRWERPFFWVIDEADRMDYEVYKTMKGTIECPIVAISTINYETRKSWFTDMWYEAAKRQREYEPIDQLIHRIWVKYGLDKCKSRDDYWVKIQNWEFDKMRREFYSARPMVALKYDITQIERYSEEEKKQMIDEAMLVSEAYCLAELFCEYADDVQLFNTEWLTENNLPDRFEEVTCWYDESDWWDNPAIVFVGFSKWIWYVLHEEKLSKDPKDRARRAKELIALYWNKSKKWKVILWADITRWDAYFREIEDTIGRIDVPVYYTKSQQDDVKIERPKHKVGKRYLVKVTKDEFFWRWWLLFSSRLQDVEWSLLDEIKYFKRKQNGKYEAESWHKDDKVNALMIALYVAYTSWIKEDIKRWDWLMEISREELVYRKQQEAEEKKQIEDEDKMIAKVYADFW